MDPAPLDATSLLFARRPQLAASLTAPSSSLLQSLSSPLRSPSLGHPSLDARNTRGLGARNLGTSGLGALASTGLGTGALGAASLLSPDSLEQQIRRRMLEMELEEDLQRRIRQQQEQIRMLQERLAGNDEVLLERLRRQLP